jgi:hypothetical protein
MNKERPGEIRRELQRVRTSRNKHKEKVCEQSLKNKRLKDRNQEITLSRNKWKNAYKQSHEELKILKRELIEKLKAAHKETRQECQKVEELQKQSEQLQYEMENLLEKKTKN